MHRSTNHPSLLGFARLSLWLGIVGFGGGFAIAQRVRHTVVEKERWLAEREYLDAFAVACALPGTSSTNLLTILGLRFHGVRGALAAATAFLMPSVALMLAFGAAYGHVRGVGTISAVLDGMSVATVGVVAAAAVDLGRSTLTRRTHWVLAAASVVLLAFHLLNLLEVVAGAALLGVLLLRTPPDAAPAKRVSAEEEAFPPASLRSVMPFASAFAFLGAPAALLFVVFARIGLVTFGGGFAMIPAIEHEVVATRGWLTEGVFNDAIVLGQITPGPVAIASTFIGYRVAGLGGAALATLGMFAPPFVLSVLAGRSIAAFRANRAVDGALRGVGPAIVGVVAAAAIALGRTSLHTMPGGLIAVGAFAWLVVFRRGSPLLPLAVGGAATWLMSL